MKNPLRSKTIDGGIILAGIIALRLFGVEVSDSELAVLAEAVAAVIGFVLVIWGRATAKEKVSMNPLYAGKDGKDQFPIRLGILTAGLSLLLMLFGGTGCQHAQDQWDRLDDGQQETVRNISKAAAQIALNLALDQLDQRVAELRPYLPVLRQTVQYALTFEPPMAADKIAEALGEIPPEYRQEILQAMREYLEQSGTETHPGVVASPPEIYGNRLLHALPKR